MGTAPYSSSLNKSRKHIGTILSKPAVAGYVHHLDLETQSFVEQCLQLGQGGAKAIDPLRLIRRMLLSLNLTLCYGRRVSLDDPILDEIAHVEHGLVNMRNTIHTLQDCIPVLQLNPFSAETRTAKQLRQRRDDYFTGLNKELDERRANGTDTPCIRSALLDQPDIDSKQVQLTCLTFVSAGMAPTSATLQWSIAMLAHRPDIQLAAFNALQDHYRQDEALAQMGTAYDDQTCVYIVALVKEFLR
jgi:3-hydroxyphenylacetate 6-hydroxylase